VTRRFPSSVQHRLRVDAVAGVVSSVVVATAVLAPVASTAVSATTPAWTIQPSPNPAGAVASGLGAVSCSTPGSCVAVGATNYPSGQQLPHQVALIERLSDGTWIIEKNPAVGSGTTSLLDGVSCPVADFCAAVGYAHPGFDLLAEIWNGTSWSETSLPSPAGGADPSLAAVSCAAKDICVAVGNYIENKTDSYRPLAERLNGSTWSLIPAPAPMGANGNSEFTGIDCPAPASCEVVGNVGYNDTLQKVFAYGLSGSTWTFHHQVNPGPDPGNTDDAVSCGAPEACTSVGSAYVVQEFVLAEYWNGSTWVRQATPAPDNRPDNTLYDVSCDAGSSCVAIGESWRVNQQNGHLVAARVRTEVWNGTSWSLSQPVVPTGVTVRLSGISCPSPSTCISVGSSSTSPTSDEATTLVEAYSG
jgi:hypothetical protein